MDFLTVFNKTAVLFVPIILGIIIRRTGMVDGNFARNLSNFLFNVSLPCSILSAMQYDLNRENLTDAFILMILGAIAVFVCLGVSFLISYIFKGSDADKNILRFAMAFSNFSFMGYPVVEALYGAEGVFYAAVYTVPFYIIVNSLGIIILQKGTQGTNSVTLKSILNLPTIAVMVGIIMFAFSFKFTGILNDCVNMFASTTTPMSMTLAGLILSDNPIVSVFKNLKVYGICFVKLIVMPAVILGLLVLFGFEGLMLKVAVVIIAMPSAINMVMITEKFGGNSKLGAEIVLTSTFISMLTIPLVYTVLSKI